MSADMKLRIVLIFFAFIWGAVFGSFSYVIVNCLVKNKNFFKKKRSRCPKCKHKLGWMDLVPIVSFLILKQRGKSYTYINV